MRAALTTLSHRHAPTAAKVPAVGVLFWVVKLLTTGAGEAAADGMAHTSLVLAAVVGVGGFTVAMWRQLTARSYSAPTYWFAVLMVAVLGTMVADGPHLVFGVPYLVMTALYALALAVVLRVWFVTEGTLSIHSITTSRRELFYWLTVLATFALGTAAGDLAAATLGLGFLGSVVLFAVVMLVPLLGWWRFEMNSILAFWFAYVLTRPLGASFADWFGKPPSFGSGLGYGDGPVAVVAIAVIVVLVGYLTVRRPDIQPRTP